MSAAAVIEQEKESETADPAGALVGTLVHRLFQFTGVSDLSDEDLAVLAERLIRPEERVTADAAALAERAARVWRDLIRRPDVAEAVAGGERLSEVPFSMMIDGRIVRGVIDAMIVRADEVLVLELKTGGPRPEHEQQLERYVRAARILFPDARVDGRLVYA
ncbi:MAG TPA: PD-(D/E)XK nuclease family protein [Vicinamibacterales bacterium]|nr:PD-(D/E)XK nuclease family protein [Vicinamibacterales bacterium]